MSPGTVQAIVESPDAMCPGPNKSSVATNSYLMREGIGIVSGPLKSTEIAILADRIGQSDDHGIPGNYSGHRCRAPGKLHVVEERPILRVQ